MFSNVEKVAITTDLWQAANQDSYLGVTVHYINRNGNLESKVLCLRHLQINHTAENIYNSLKSILEEWLLLEKARISKNL